MLATFGAYLVVRNFIRNKLNRHFVTQMDINSDIYSKWLRVVQSRSQMALKLRFTERLLDGYFRVL